MKSSQTSPLGSALPNCATADSRVVVELLVGHRRARVADDREPVRQQPLGVQVEERGQQLALGEVAGRPEDDDGLRVGRLERHARAPRAGFSAWPPNSLRIAERSRLREVRLPLRGEPAEQRRRQHVGRARPRPRPPAASTAPRPNRTRVRRTRRGPGSAWSACAVRSSSQDETTLPRRQSSATFGDVDVVVVVVGVVERRRLRVGVTRRRAGVGVGQDVQPLGVRRHEPVLDPVVHHLHEVAGAVRPAVQPALLLGSRVARPSRVRAGGLDAGRERAKHRREPRHRASGPPTIRQKPRSSRTRRRSRRRRRSRCPSRAASRPAARRRDRTSCRRR